MKTTKIILSIMLIALSIWLLLLDTNPSYNWLRFFVIVTLISIPVAYVFGSVEFKRRAKPEDVISPELLNFLKEKGILKEFMDNYNSKQGRKWRKYWCGTNYVKNIDDAFEWSKTLEGEDYWVRLDSEIKSRIYEEAI